MNIQKAHHNPTTVEVVQVTDENIYEVAGWIGGRVSDKSPWHRPGDLISATIYFNEGYVTMAARPGDWAMRSGNNYPASVTDEEFRSHWTLIDSDDEWNNNSVKR